MHNRERTMSKCFRRLICVGTVFIVFLTSVSTAVANPSVRRYGTLNDMHEMGKRDGVIKLRDALSAAHTYAVGTIQFGLGEITTIAGVTWLDYGYDGLGNAITMVPAEEAAVVLLTSDVSEWEETIMATALAREELYRHILTVAKERGIDVGKPFPFLLEGVCSRVLMHVSHGRNLLFSEGTTYEPIFKHERKEWVVKHGVMVGFYMPPVDGEVEREQGEWFLHMVIPDENSTGCVDDIATQEGMVLKLPKN